MIEIGAKLTVEKTVTPELTAQVAGSGLLPVFGTPFMAAMMENAAPKKLSTDTNTTFTRCMNLLPFPGSS